MNPILFAVLVVAGIGLVVGIVLAVASAVMAVPKDEKAEAVLEVLPGANCGACGFSGCSGYAKALAQGSAKPGLWLPRRRRNDKSGFRDTRHTGGKNGKALGGRALLRKPWPYGK